MRYFGWSVTGHSPASISIASFPSVALTLPEPPETKQGKKLFCGTLLKNSGSVSPVTNHFFCEEETAMKWRDLFSPVNNITATQAKELLSTTPAIQLLDVRQPSEYEKSHLPGARLIPLKELPAKIPELDRSKPVLVYCAVGGRSRAAAQLLTGKDFSNVSNLSGGIRAWQGATADGTEERGFDLLPPESDFEHIYAMAYSMEDALERFYRKIAADCHNKTGELAQRLAGFEKDHKLKLLSLFPGISGQNTLAAKGVVLRDGTFEGAATGGTGKRSCSADDENSVGLLETAAGFEAQAWDLYDRLARRSTAPATRELFTRLAREEQMHLGYVTDMLANQHSRDHTGPPQ